jgi:hypothetical protein
MSDYTSKGRLAPLFLGTWSPPHTDVALLRSFASAGAGALTWVANLAVYVPFYLPAPMPVRRVWWINGSTITTSNADVGVFNADGVRMLSAGLTALAGASAVQYATLGADKLLMPGRYYFGYVCDNTTARAQGTSSWTAAQLRHIGVLQEALGSAALPAKMTPVAIANALFPYCGITRTPSGF